MSIILVGLNHRTAPVELREQLTLTGSALLLALEDLRTSLIDSGPLYEAVIVSTCNRLEIYASASQVQAGWEALEAFISRWQAEARPYLYALADEEAVEHVMRVTCGLDSMILGEPQILGQVAQAFEDAHRAGVCGPVLSRLLAQAIHTGKRARTETDISRYSTSVSHAAARLLISRLSAPRPQVLIVGAGEMALLAARALLAQGVTELAFINRTYPRAEALAAEFGGQAFGWSQLADALRWADGAITATGAPHTVIYARDITGPLLLVDVAVPRDVEVVAGDLPGVTLYDIDDLHSIVDSNTAQRRAAQPLVEAIIEHERGLFFAWYHSRQVTPVIQNLRRWATDVAQSEVDQALNRLQDADERTVEVVNRLAHRLVNKLLHEPTVRLRGQAAVGSGHDYAHAICELFGLHERCEGCMMGRCAPAPRSQPVLPESRQ